ncbi:MAG: MmcQ/YjbR family DNA-binding protein [Bacteroidia bacterium]|nr:MmcQ/YjbR family DNA-binding protein [Bacteroidia bacterium]
MIKTETVTEMALSYEGVVELPHFEKTSFRVNKKIFATLDKKNNTAVLKFSKLEQSVFSAYDKLAIYPVPGKWGLQGFTMVDLKRVKKNVFKDALKVSYCNVAPKKLSEKYQSAK